jgi:hypothetical protein
MSLGDQLAIANLVVASVTSVCAIYLAWTALRNTVRPNLTFRMVTPSVLLCDHDEVLVFEVLNVGNWYGSPMAVDVTAYFDFPASFGLKELRYGSVQEHINVEVKNGKGGMRYLKAKGIKVSRQRYGEEVHVHLRTPIDMGMHLMRVSGYSANGASTVVEFPLKIVDSLDRVVLI